jgi:hypothetical protein
LAGQHCYQFGGHYGGGAITDGGHVDSAMVHTFPTCNWSGTIGLFNSCSGLDTSLVHRAHFGSVPADCHITTASNYPTLLGQSNIIPGVYSEHAKCW